jgi:hypothetical protein
MPSLKLIFHILFFSRGLCIKNKTKRHFTSKILYPVLIGDHLFDFSLKSLFEAIENRSENLKQEVK